MSADKLILLTGATGYVGGRLLPLLERRGLQVRCLTRRPENLATRVAESTELVAGDILDPKTLEAAFAGVDTDALSSSGPEQRWGGVRFGSRIVDSRTATVECPAAQAFAPIQRIGGETGWYYGNWLWQIRGFLDLIVGGVGVRRGRRDPENIRVGDALDFWRVEAFETDRLLRLQAEMKVPGRAWLEFEVTDQGTSSTIHQTAIFDPVGLLGLAYWYALFPLHQFIFAGMLRNVARAAEKPTTNSA